MHGFCFLTFNIYFPGRLKREVDPTAAKPESPPKPQKKPKPPKPQRYKDIARCNSHNSQGKECKKWARTICIKGKDSETKECQKSGGDSESGSQGLGDAGGVVLTILVFINL